MHPHRRSGALQLQLPTGVVVRQSNDCLDFYRRRHRYATDYCALIRVVNDALIWTVRGDRQGCTLTRVELREVRAAIGKRHSHMGVIYELDRYGSGVLPEDGADQDQKSAPCSGSDDDAAQFPPAHVVSMRQPAGLRVE